MRGQRQLQAFTDEGVEQMPAVCCMVAMAPQRCPENALKQFPAGNSLSQHSDCPVPCLPKTVGALSLHQDSVLVGKLKAADWAGAVVVQPLADAGGAEAVLAGQLHDPAAAPEVVQADLALLQRLLPPRCLLRTAHAHVSTRHQPKQLPV